MTRRTASLAQDFQTIVPIKKERKGERERERAQKNKRFQRSKGSICSFRNCGPGDFPGLHMNMFGSEIGDRFTSGNNGNIEETRFLAV